MRQARRKHRAMRAGLGLAVVLAIGFAADAFVLVKAPARADAAAATDAPAKVRRSTLAVNPPKPVRLAGSGTWAPMMAGITLVLAVCGGIIAAGRRFLPQGTSVGMQVVGRVSLSPKHAVYMLKVGRRVLLVGAGPQGAPALISELDDLSEIEPDTAPCLPHGEQTC